MSSDDLNRDDLPDTLSDLRNSISKDTDIDKSLVQPSIDKNELGLRDRIIGLHRVEEQLNKQLEAEDDEIGE